MTGTAITGLDNTKTYKVEVTAEAPAEAPTTYTVTFDSKDGSAVDSISDVAKDSTLTLPESPTKEGFTFDGWYVDDTTFANEFTTTKTVTADVTVYAKWITLI